MDKYITCVKTPVGDKFDIMVVIPDEAYGITWYAIDHKNSKNSKSKVIERETTRMCYLESDDIKKNYEGKWLCCEYRLRGNLHQDVALYLSSDILTMIRKNQFDMVDFFDTSNGYPKHEGEYKCRWNNGQET